MNLKGELHNIKKVTDSMDIYLQKIKVVRDKLLAIGVIADDEELLHITIKGLPKDYNAFRSARMVYDRAARDHVTSSLNHLSFPKPYNG